PQRRGPRTSGRSPAGDARRAGRPAAGLGALPGPSQAGEPRAAGALLRGPGQHQADRGGTGAAAERAVYDPQALAPGPLRLHQSRPGGAGVGMNERRGHLPPLDDELWSLVEAALGGTATAEERERLEARLRTEPQTRAASVTYLDLHA